MESIGIILILLAFYLIFLVDNRPEKRIQGEDERLQAHIMEGLTCGHVECVRVKVVRIGLAGCESLQERVACLVTAFVITDTRATTVSVIIDDMEPGKYDDSIVLALKEKIERWL